MPPAKLPSNEAERLEALASFDVMDTASEEVFDDIVELAARLTGSPTALISLVDADRQWFKARHGLDLAETDRSHSFCAHAILDPSEPLIVEDATLDERFADNPLVTGESAVRSYLGLPLVTTDGHALGALCVLDNVPKVLDPAAVLTLRTLARAVTTNLELRRAVRSAQAIALTDSLTGLPNRRAFTATLNARMTEGLALSIVAIDLDFFKEVNDSEGHEAGDLLLRETAERLRRAIRPSDMVARLGGDEFVACLFGVSDRDLALEIATRISTTLNKPVTIGTRSLHLGATLGVAVSGVDSDKPELLLRAADEALLRTKRTGRGCVGWATQDDADRLARNVAILKAFDASVTEAGVTGASVHLQPILALRTGRSATPSLVSVEALARWRHDDVGAVPPGELFAMMGPSRAGRLGTTIRDQALVAFASLQPHGLAGKRVALNLSVSEVSRADIAFDIEAQVERAGLSLRSVEFDITEEVLLDRVSDRALQQLAVLRGRGARIVLDDFGTGHSGLGQLLRMPLDGVKLDMRFIQRLGVDPRAEEIVRTTISLAHGLDLNVVAEGVETDLQASMLLELGCDRVQGFLYAPPMTPEALRAWLEAARP